LFSITGGLVEVALAFLQYGRLRQRLQRPLVVLETPQLVHEPPRRHAHETTRGEAFNV